MQKSLHIENANRQIINENFLINIIILKYSECRVNQCIKKNDSVNN